MKAQTYLEALVGARRRMGELAAMFVAFNSTIPVSDYNPAAPITRDPKELEEAGLGKRALVCAKRYQRKFRQATKFEDRLHLYLVEMGQDLGAYKAMCAKNDRIIEGYQRVFKAQSISIESLQASRDMWQRDFVALTEDYRTLAMRAERLREYEARLRHEYERHCDAVDNEYGLQPSNWETWLDGMFPLPGGPDSMKGRDDEKEPADSAVCAADVLASDDSL